MGISEIVLDVTEEVSMSRLILLDDWLSNLCKLF
jgi:hypothetical protein